jgi:hypothetical protein
MVEGARCVFAAKQGMPISIRFVPFRDDFSDRVAALERSDNVALRTATLSLRSSTATPSVAVAAVRNFRARLLLFTARPVGTGWPHRAFS